MVGVTGQIQIRIYYRSVFKSGPYLRLVRILAQFVFFFIL